VNLAPNRIGAAVALSLHAAVGATVLSYEPARTALLTAAPIMVDWIAAPRPEPVIEPPRPKPVHRPVPKPVEKPPLIAAPAESPSPILAPAPPPPPEPVAAAEPPPPPAAFTSPVFDAAYLRNPLPPYPLVSRRLKEQGRVILRVRVSAAGTAEEVQVRTSSGYLRLDQSAREAVSHWKFEPARRGGVAITEWVLVPIPFELDG